MTETVLVTGGSGFIASWCIAVLLQRGYAVRATVRSPAKGPALQAAVAKIADTTRLSFAQADLTADAGWDEAMAGCAYVLHVASPLGAGAGSSTPDLITPARDGTLRVLRAAVKAGVKRVVMTSAAATATGELPGVGPAYDEILWTDPKKPGLDPYRRSKILAERAAWDFMRDNGGSTQFATVLPGAVFGPLLLTDSLGSAQVIRRLLQGRPQGVPRIGFYVVDVRDLADLHVKAMTHPAAAGERFIGAGDWIWMRDIAAILRRRLGASAVKVPTRALPDTLVRFLAIFMPPLRMLTPTLGLRLALPSDKARRVLGFNPRPGEEAVVDCARSLIAESLA